MVPGEPGTGEPLWRTGASARQCCYLAQPSRCRRHRCPPHLAGLFAAAPRVVLIVRLIPGALGLVAGVSFPIVGGLCIFVAPRSSSQLLEVLRQQAALLGGVCGRGGVVG